MQPRVPGARTSEHHGLLQETPLPHRLRSDDEKTGPYHSPSFREPTRWGVHHPPTQPEPIRLTLPSCPLADQVQRLAGPSIKVATKSGIKLGDIVKIKRPPHLRPTSQVYSVPCGTCPLHYLGETSRGYTTREAEHRRDLRNHNESNAFVIHADKTGHLPSWKDHTIKASGIPKQRRLIIESALIATTKNINTATGFHDLARPIAEVIAAACQVT